MDKIKYVKLEQPDGSYSDSIPLSVDSDHVDVNGSTLTVELNKIDNLETQINKKPYYYTNIASMKTDDNLKEGDVVQTLGYYEANDGKAELYNIVDDNTLIDDDYNIIELNNDLFAKRVQNEKIDESYIIEEITVEEHYDEQTKTHYWITHVPHTDKNGNIIKMNLGLANDVENENVLANETARSFANRHNATLCINGGVFNVTETSDYYLRCLGLVIKDKEVVCDIRNEVRNEGIVNQGYLNRINILGVKDDNTLIKYNYNVNAEAVLSDDCDFTIAGFGRIMVNGESTNRTEGDNWGVASYSITEDTAPIANKIYFVVENGVYKGKVNLTEFEAGTDYYEQTGGTFYEFCFIGQNTTTKDFYIFTCNGKGTEVERGMSHEQAIAIFQDLGVDFAWQPDRRRFNVSDISWRANKQKN